VYQTKNHQSLRASLLVGVASASVLAFAGTAAAQDATAETVIVTGSRLPQANLTTVSPVTSISSDDIANTGVTRIEDIVNQLPQAFAAQNATVSNGATGTATLNLRGLGETRTLVLVDGRRMPYGSPFSPAADINQIPGVMVERVEVLTGGASAVYGSDAIAGVVNFIMRKDFEGVEVDLSYDFYWHENDYDGEGNLRAEIAARAATNPGQFFLPEDTFTDGDGHQESIIMGVNSANGKGNVTAYFTHRKNKPLLQANRDYSACALGAPGNGVDGQFGFTCGGSGTAFPGTFTDFSNFSYTIDSVNPGPNGLFNQFRPFVAATDQYNFGPLNYYQRPDERYSFGAFGHYEVAPWADIYGSLMFTDYRTRSQIAPSGNFFSTPTINCDNPLMSDQQRDLICADDRNSDLPGVQSCDSGDIDPCSLYIGRRNVEGGGRQDDLHYESWRVNGGVRGPISDHWSYDLNAQIARVQLSRVYLNDFSVTRLNRALNVVDDGGTPTCASVLDGTDTSCVPYNIFQLGGVTPEALAYLQIPLMQNATMDQQILNLTFTGDLPSLTSPFATNPMQLAFGAEYRYDKLENTTDTNFASGDGAGQGGPTIGLTGALDVLEVFMETKIPLIENAPLAHEVSFEGAYRFSRYSSGIEADTYKLAANWSPTEDFRIRGAYQRALRAPNVIELFSAQGFNLFDQAFDPCDANNNPNFDDIAGACVGDQPWQITDAQVGNPGIDSPAGQYNFLQGGNPDLGPETADTWTYGVVLTPTFLPGFIASVDYFDIEVVNLIGAVNPTDIERLCYENGDLGQCARINRNTGNGSLWVTGPDGSGFIESLNTNIGGLSTKGIDINVYYRFTIDESWGAFSVNLVGTWLDELTTDTGLGLKFDCVGFFSSSCGTPNPEWRHRLRMTWELPVEEWNPALSVTWRRYSEVDSFGSTPLLGSHFDAQNYWDVGISADIMTGTSFRFGINNVFDDDPPLSHIVGTTGNGNTFPQTYDAFGRYVFAGVTIKM
jgi:iron complex outermembrane recepter protein